MGNTLFGQGYAPKEATGSKALPAGGYIARIMNAKMELAKSSGLPMVVIQFDIAEGEYKDFYRQKYLNAKNYGADAKWQGVGRIPAVDAEGKAREGFNRFCGAIEKSNDCKLPTDDDMFLLSLKDKYIGILMGREEYRGNDGRLHWSTKPKFYRSTETIESGNYTVPEDEPLKGSGYSDPYADSFAQAAEDLPF